MRTIQTVYSAPYAPMGDLVTYTPLPSRAADMIDPFLLLNHHGPQVYPPHNNGLPFGPHPHRGMETVTFIIDGDIMHRDNGGHESVITAGGVQWMTAGRGLIHAEVSSEEFLENGGPLEILQLWLNLPARLKMTEPFYKGLQQEDIPSVTSDDGRVTTTLIAGGTGAAFTPQTGVTLRTITFRPDGTTQLAVPADHSILFYVIRGALEVNGRAVGARQMALFEHDGETIDIRAQEESILLFGHAAPIGEPVVAQGPFVMNTREEIMQAYNDYRAGKFGTWQE